MMWGCGGTKRLRGTALSVGAKAWLVARVWARARGRRYYKLSGACQPYEPPSHGAGLHVELKLKPGC